MGLLCSPKKNNDINSHLLNKISLLFVDSSINNEYNKINESLILPLSLYSIICVYSFLCFITIIANKNNSTEIVLITIAMILTLFSFVIYTLFKFKKKLFNIKNTKYCEFFLLAIAYIMMTLVDRIMCYHFKEKKENIKDKFFFEFIFTNVDIVIKFIWLIFDINEFIFVSASNVISFIIICSYYDNDLPLYYSLIVTKLFIIFFHSVLSYIITFLQKKEFLIKRYQTEIEKYADLLNLGYFSLSMNSKKSNCPYITQKSSFFEQKTMRSLYPDDRKLISILTELEDINKDMKMCEERERMDSELSNHYNTSSNGNNNYNNTNSQLFNIRDQGNSIYKQNASGSEFPFVFQQGKKNSILNLKSINFKNESEVFGKRRTMLNIRNNNISIKRSDNHLDNKDDIRLNINTDNSIDMNNDDFIKVISMLSKYIKKNKNKLSQNFEYFGRKKIQLMIDKENITTSTVKEMYLKILFKYNSDSNSYQFLFIDESQYQYDLIFKRFAQQISMYLHDFKNPLISLNEKVIELKEMFTNLHLHSHSDKAAFEFGKDFINEFSFLSITTSDCVDMIKSYESFSKKIVDPHSAIKLDLSLFNLRDILSYIKDWIDIKITQSNKEIVFSINYDKTIPKDFIMCSDKLKLKQVLINILSNSFKFTDRGFITLLVSREAIDNKDYIKFVIQDSGIGMSEKTKQKLFQPYFSRNEDKNNKDGCGLGLIITQMMSANLGKAIEVESIEGQGTKMWFYCEEKTPTKGMMSSTLFKKRKEMFSDNVIAIINNNSESFEVANKYSMNELARPLSSQSIQKKGDYILDRIKARTTKSLQMINKKEDSNKNTLKDSDNTLVCDEIIAISPTNKISKRKQSTNSIKRKSASMFTKPKLFSNFKSSMNLQTISGVTLYNNNHDLKRFNTLYSQNEIAFTLYGEMQSQNCSPIILTTAPSIYSKKSLIKFGTSTRPNRDEKSTGTGTTNANTISVRGEYQNIVTLNSRRNQNCFSVLIIDDDKLCQSSLCRIINEFNINNIYIEYLYDGIEFLIRFLTNDISSFNLIIMDNHMRRMDGIDAVNMISLMKANDIGEKCRFDYNTIFSKLWIYSADADEVINGLMNKESVGIISKPATKSDISNVLRKAGAI